MRKEQHNNANAMSLGWCGGTIEEKSLWQQTSDYDIVREATVTFHSLKLCLHAVLSQTLKKWRV